MAVSIVDVLKEKARQARTGDTEWSESRRWAFRVISPKGNRGPCGLSGEAIFPLPINPDRFEYTLPFANEVTPQQEGGVVVESAGIVIATITMSGTTGFKLRRQRSSFRGGSGSKFTGFLPDAGSIFAEDVSGQMAFWVLANKCFEGYSELVGDPETAAETRMELFIPKDTLALEVVPKSFALTRQASAERVTYRYNIVLDVIGEAEIFEIKGLQDEKDAFDEILDTISTIRDTIQQVAATVDDLTAAADQLRRVWQNFGSFISDIGTIFDSCSAFVAGIKRYVDIPKSFMSAVADTAEDAATLFADTATLPADVGQSFASLGDYLDTLVVACRDHYKSSWDEVVDTYNKRTSPRYAENRTDEDEQDEIESTASSAADGGGGMTASQVYGSPFLPGDSRRAALGKSGSRMKAGLYNGFSEKSVGQGDTLASIAARELGDPSKWPELALINNLSPPYITSGPKLPGTLQPGSRIIIPISKPVQPAQVLSTGNPVIGSSQADTHLGTDLELVQISKGQWGWKTDKTHGAVDGVKVSGIGNLSQGLGARLRTERRTNILYPDVGLDRMVGENQMEDQSTWTQFQIRKQILSDPRIDRLISAQVTAENDAVTIEIKAQPLGATTPRTISQTIT